MGHRHRTSIEMGRERPRKRESRIGREARTENPKQPETERCGSREKPKEGDSTEGEHAEPWRHLGRVRHRSKTPGDTQRETEGEGGMASATEAAKGRETGRQGEGDAKEREMPGG